MDEDRETEDRAGRDPPAAAAVTAGLEREHGAPLQPREEQRVRAAERRVQHRDRRDRGQEHDAGGAAVADQLARDQRDGRQRETRKDERREAQRLETGPPALQEVLEPEVQRPAAALRRDDVEDVPERELGDPERQLLVDVERRPPDGLERDGDEQRGGRERRAGQEQPLLRSTQGA